MVRLSLHNEGVTLLDRVRYDQSCKLFNCAATVNKDFEGIDVDSSSIYVSLS